MNLFQRIREASFRAVSKFLNEDDDDRLDMEIVGELDPYLTSVVRDINEQHSTGRVIPLRRAG